MASATVTLGIVAETLKQIVATEPAANVQIDELRATLVALRDGIKDQSVP